MQKLAKRIPALDDGVLTVLLWVIADTASHGPQQFGSGILGNMEIFIHLVLSSTTAVYQCMITGLEAYTMRCWLWYKTFPESYPRPQRLHQPNRGLMS